MTEDIEDFDDEEEEEEERKEREREIVKDNAYWQRQELEAFLAYDETDPLPPAEVKDEIRKIMRHWE